MKPNPAARDALLRRLGWILLGATVIVVLIARVRLAGLPLERDEGEYAYGGQLLLLGVPPYKLAYSMKLPGTAAAYALIMLIFGQSLTAIHIGLALVNLLTIALVYFLGREILGELCGIASAASYSVLSLMPYMLGTAAHATHLVVLFATAGAVVLLRMKDRRSPLLIMASGILFGLAFLMKQPGLFFVLFGAVWLFAHDLRAQHKLKSVLYRNVLFLISAAVPYLITALALWRAGVFERFWFWTFKYASEYGGAVSLNTGFQLFAGHFFDVIGNAWPIWLFALVGLISFAIARGLGRGALTLVLFAICSALAVCAGLYFRPHYFILFLPAMSLMTGAVFVTISGLTGTRGQSLQVAVLGVFAACLAFPLWSERDFFFELPIPDANRLINGTNPFRESIKIAEYIRDQSTPGDRIAVLGSEPQIYFYSKRLSATGYIYTYGLMEPQPYAHQMQEEMIREIEAARPRFLVLVVANKSWLADKNSDQTIVRWADQYCEAGYEEIGLVNISENGTDYYFSPRRPGVTSAGDHILIYRRKT